MSISYFWNELFPGLLMGTIILSFIGALGLLSLNYHAAVSRASKREIGIFLDQLHFPLSALVTAFLGPREKAVLAISECGNLRQMAKTLRFWRSLVGAWVCVPLTIIVYIDWTSTSKGNLSPILLPFLFLVPIYIGAWRFGHKLKDLAAHSLSREDQMLFLVVRYSTSRNEIALCATPSELESYANLLYAVYAVGAPFESRLWVPKGFLADPYAGFLSSIQLTVEGSVLEVRREGNTLCIRGSTKNFKRLAEEIEGLAERLKQWWDAGIYTRIDCSSWTKDISPKSASLVIGYSSDFAGFINGGGE